MGSYQTIKNRSEAFLKEKGSKFYAYAFPIQAAEEVKELLASVESQHPKARHICTAFLIGQGSDEYYLVNDDGEPSNSAGMPILAAIRSAEITNTYIAVVRYFGGTKLGMGGLIQAYRGVAREAIESNKIITIEPKDSFTLKVNYTLLGEVLSVADKNNLNIKQEHQADYVLIRIECKEKELEKIKGLFDRFEVEID
ncbi:MAG: YigZ family protein [Vicingaceae bacterium]